MTDPDLLGLFIEPLERPSHPPRSSRRSLDGPEYFRASGSERHLRDVAMMLRVSGESVDEPELDRRVGHLGLGAALRRARDYDID